MSDNKKYYYLKLKENFFETDELKILESMPNGYMYSNLLLKLYLKALKYEGKLQLNEYIPYNPQMIATVTNLNIDVVTAGLKVLEQLKLIDVLPDGTIYMIQIQNFIGLSSTEADRKRNYRNKIEDEKNNLLPEGQMSGQNEDKCPKERDKNPPEIELDIEKELDINTSIDELWKLYPLKAGKSKAIKKIPSLIKTYGLEQMKNAITRYIDYVEHRRSTDFKDLKYQNGSTFFNGGYQDYLDESYAPIAEIASTGDRPYWSNIDS